MESGRKSLITLENIPGRQSSKSRPSIDYMTQRESDQEGLVIVHSGTTVENYQTCAYASGDTVIFDKMREPRHVFKPFFYVPAFEGGARYAFAAARELDQEPCVIAGKVSADQRFKYELPEGETFSVDRVWKPKAGFDWRKLRPYASDTLKDFFDELDPRELLAK